jgi:hypothetical protein
MNRSVSFLALCVGILLLTGALLQHEGHAQAQTAIQANPPRCPPPAPAVALMAFVAGQFQCVPLGPGLSIQGGAIVASQPAPYTPAWQVESISLATLAAGATTVSYTPLKPVAGGTVFWWYQSDLAHTASGAIAYTGAPVTVTLPTGWAATDTVLIAYQSQ